MNKRFCKLGTYAARAFFLFALCGAGASCSDDYKWDNEDPQWLGSSIYDYLNTQGNYTNVVRLINDLGYKEVLARTGSKTLFVADDEAFERFYRKNDWGVSSYDQLSLAQKKSLLFGAMINNSCQVAYLSSTQGPIEGDCMRRQTSQSLYDSVPIMKPTMMPQTPYWQYYIDNNKTIPCFTDMTTRPMIHFIEDFLTNRLITNSDCDFLFNYQTKRQPGDANVNGVIMTEQNIKCSNGFVHKMGEVITALPNMAEIVNNKPQTSSYAKLLDRFCAPYYAGDEATREYNRLYNQNVDSVFKKQYFSDRSSTGKLETTPWEGPVNGMLKFDPGWNSFYSETSSGTSNNVAVQQNMGVMLVPTNKALEEYWNEGAGKVLRDYYGSWDNVPDKVVSKMLNVNMLNSFTGSVPSKFETVLNDARDEMGITTEHVDSVFMACNGAVYLTNRVFNPVAYVSVSFPALINETMNIFYWGIEQCGYDVYLNSQQSRYSLFIPTNNAMLSYIDPCSYGKSKTQILRFRYDGTQLEKNRVKASLWDYDPETGVVGDSINEISYDEIKNRLEEILNTHIVIGDVEDGNEYYMTKGGTTLRVKNANLGENGMTVQGSAQIEDAVRAVNVTRIYDESKEGNGKTYILDSEPILCTRKSVLDILATAPEYSEFYDILAHSSFIEQLHEVGSAKHGCASDNINFFNTFRYTVLAPTNEAILAEIKAGNLPTWDEIWKLEDPEDPEYDENLTDEERESIKKEKTEKIEDFIRYHIVDNTFFIGQGTETGKYETSAYSVNGAELSYHKVDVNCSNSGLTITDAVGNTHKVLTNNPALYNRIAREWIYEESDPTQARRIYTSSNAVVHLIDGVLKHK